MTQETNGASVAHLADRGAVSVTGPDAAKFLQGLVTNDVECLVTKPDDVAFAASAAHAALLSPQGKILFDFFCARTLDGFVLDVVREKAVDKMHSALGEHRRLKREGQAAVDVQTPSGGGDQGRFRKL